jgi:hypothetical protein
MFAAAGFMLLSLPHVRQAGCRKPGRLDLYKPCHSTVIAPTGAPLHTQFRAPSASTATGMAPKEKLRGEMQDAEPSPTRRIAHLFTLPFVEAIRN